MIKLKSLIGEYGRDLNRTQETDLENIKRGIDTGDFTNAWRNHTEGEGIYRGISKDFPYAIVKPSQYNRQSKNTNNFYTTLMDNLYNWKEYPKRSRSVICSSEIGGASSFGTVYILLPKNGSKIGICSDNDLWSSFPYVNEKLEVYSMDDFNRTFSLIFRDININIEEIDTNYKKMLEILDIKLNIRSIKNGEISIPEKVGHSRSNTRLNNLILMSNYLNWEDLFNNIMNPDNNSFKLTTIENYSTPSDRREVWTDGDCLFINQEYLKKL